MLTIRWLVNRAAKSFRSPSRGNRPRRSSYCPRLDPLEDRLLLSAYLLDPNPCLTGEDPPPALTAPASPQSVDGPAPAAGTGGSTAQAAADASGLLRTFTLRETFGVSHPSQLITLDPGQPGDQFLFNLCIAIVAIPVNFVASLPGAFRELLAGRLHSRVPATLLIAIGAFFPTLTDSLNRAGSTDLYQLGKFLGVLFLFAGFLVSVEVFREVRIPFTSIRLGFSRYLSLALEFQLASDILSTAIAPSWDEIGKLGATATIRTALNFFLSREMQEYAEKQSREESKVARQAEG